MKNIVKILFILSIIINFFLCFHFRSLIAFEFHSWQDYEGSQNTPNPIFIMSDIVQVRRDINNINKKLMDFDNLGIEIKGYFIPSILINRITDATKTKDCTGIFVSYGYNTKDRNYYLYVEGSSEPLPKIPDGENTDIYCLDTFCPRACGWRLFH